MIKAIFASQSLTAALLLSTPCWAQAQQENKQEQIIQEEEIVKPTPGNRRLLAPGKGPDAFGGGGGSITFSPAAANGAAVATKRIRSTAAREDAAPVVVEFSDKAGNIEPLQSELGVMAALIRKAVESAATDESLALGNGLVLSRAGGTSVRAMYVEGFGAIVFVKVNYPVLAPGATEAVAPKKDADSEWDQAKQELLADKRKTMVLDVAQGQPYAAAQVESLKSEIFDALKDATNLHSIKSSEFVAVTVFGPPAAAPQRAGVSELRGTVLTMRAQKSDIDALAAGSLDAAKFKEKAAIAAYAGSGYGVASVNSWARSGSFQVREIAK